MGFAKALQEALAGLVRRILRNEPALDCHGEQLGPELVECAQRSRNSSSDLFGVCRRVYRVVDSFLFGIRR